MKLYIVRHAIAEERDFHVYPNDDRPLSKIGVRKMLKNAKAIAKIISEPVGIFSSPLTRACHTAEILASTLKQSTLITRSDSLLPEASADTIIQLCKQYSGGTDILIVCHEPSLGIFLSALLRQKNQPLLLKKGSLCCIEFNADQPKKSSFLFYIPPKILRTRIR